MWTMARGALFLFLRGQLFAEPAKAYRLLATGILLTALICSALALAGVPVWAAALAAGFVGGGLQPLLFKKIRFR
jgi:hypothetical protein